MKTDLENIMTLSEASLEWGIKDNTIRASLTRGRFNKQIKNGLVKKSGTTWLIHKLAMDQIYGKKAPN